MKFHTPGIEAAPIIRATAIMLLHTGIRIAFDWRGRGVDSCSEHAFYALQDKVLELLSEYGGEPLPNFFYVVGDHSAPHIVATPHMSPRLSRGMEAYRINVLDTLRNGVITFAL